MPPPANDAAAEALMAAYVAQQRLIASTLARDLVLLVRQTFNPNDLGRSWAATKVALDPLIRDRRRRSADLAVRYYVDLRRISLPQTRSAALGTPSTRSATPALSAPSRAPTVDPATGLLRPAAPGLATPRPAAAPEQAAVVDLAEPETELNEEDAWAELERIVPVERSELNDDRVDANLNATGIASYQKAVRAGQDPERARDTMAVNLTGSATTLALEGGREVIHEAVADDDEAIGWARITDDNPCAFCAMLASRGAVYRSAETAGGRTNKRFVGDGMFKYHNHDQCVAKPIWDPDDPALEVADELYDRWLKVTRAEPGKKMIDAWTEYWNGLDLADKPTVQAQQ